MPVQLLCIGDIHLGRRIPRVPPDLGETRVADVWRSAVDLALRRGVDAVLLAGDVVDRTDDRFEAYAHLAREVARLLERGIRVFAVAGNHDVEALPRLVEHVPEVTLLGAGGRWQCEELVGGSGDAVLLLGWSYAEEEERRNPLADLPRLPDGDRPVVGLLHCTVNGGRNDPAPVPRGDLEASPVNAWLLGHIHRPDALESGRPIGYLGSLLGLDAGEPGCRGPWIASVRGSGAIDLEQVPVSPLRWEGVDVDIGPLAAETAEDVSDALWSLIREAIESLHARIESSLGPATAIGCRLRLHGRSRWHREVRRWVATQDLDLLAVPTGSRSYFVEKVVDDGVPDLPIDSLSRERTPPGILARCLRELRDETPDGQRLVEKALRGEPGRVRRQIEWSRLRLPDLERGEARDLLLRAGTVALEELLLQESDTGGGPGGPSR